MIRVFLGIRMNCQSIKIKKNRLLCSQKLEQYKKNPYFGSLVEVNQ